MEYLSKERYDEIAAELALAKPSPQLTKFYSLCCEDMH